VRVDAADRGDGAALQVVVAAGLVDTGEVSVMP
jgi:hypothetical protein